MKYSLRSLMIVVTLVFCVLLGLLYVLSDGPPDQSLTSEEKRIVEIARQAFAENSDWVDRTEFHLFLRPTQNPDGDWIVVASYHPATPGRQVYITINADGKVAEYKGGK